MANSSEMWELGQTVPCYSQGDRPRERACAHSLFSVSQPPSLPLTCTPLPQIPGSPRPHSPHPKLLSFWALYQKPPELRGRATSRASRSAVTVSRCGTLSAQGVCVFTLHGPPRRMWLVRRARGVNILGGVAPGLGCCVHALVLFLLLVHPVVTTTQTCLRPPGALPPGGRPSTAEGSLPFYR